MDHDVPGENNLNIKFVSGNIIIYPDLNDYQSNSRWLWSDMGNYYGAGYSSHTFKDNYVEVFLIGHGIRRRCWTCAACFARRLLSTKTSGGARASRPLMLMMMKMMRCSARLSVRTPNAASHSRRAWRAARRSVTGLKR